MPKELPIILHPDPRLRLVAAEIAPEEIAAPAFQELLRDMEETMLKKDGAGLAAPQVNASRRAVVVRHNDRTIFLINPRLTKKSWAREIEEEGCLSVVNEQGEIIYAPVARCKKVSCVFWDEKGQKQKISGEKMLARVIQHEIDHLDGILFIDKIVGRKALKKIQPA